MDMIEFVEEQVCFQRKFYHSNKWGCVTIRNLRSYSSTVRRVSCHMTRVWHYERHLNYFVVLRSEIGLITENHLNLAESNQNFFRGLLWGEFVLRLNHFSRERFSTFRIFGAFPNEMEIFKVIAICGKPAPVEVAWWTVQVWPHGY